MDLKLAQSCKVLIVDDQVLAQGYMKYSLEELGFRDITYEDKANKAIKLIANTHYDLIVCSYNLKKDQDGYHLYDELKSSYALSPRTAFVFISADTNAELVHSIVEMQPDDFLAKPFTVKDLDKRLTRVLTRKQALKKIYRLIENQDYQQALSEVELFLTDPDQSQFFPLALKTKGEMLLACHRAEEAKAFYQAILNVQNFTWAQVGMVNALIKLGEDDEAEKMILRLAFKPDSQLLAFDLLSGLHIKQEDFNTALESKVMATEISPRNIRRHHQVMDLSRITHDYEVQFETAKNIVKFSKDSIHDKPQNYLNVVRAGIDFAMTADDDETDELLHQAKGYLKQFETSFPKAEKDNATKVINARLLFLQDEKDKAQALIEQLDEESLEEDAMDDLLDKAKAFHELGLYDKSEAVLQEIEQRCLEDENQSQTFMRYIQQERKERSSIKQTPKELNNNAVAQYQRGDLDNALKSFRQAFTVMPKNSSIALNLLQTIAMNTRSKGLPENAKQVIQSCISTVEAGTLNEEQKERYLKVRQFLEQAI